VGSWGMSGKRQRWPPVCMPVAADAPCCHVHPTCKPASFELDRLLFDMVVANHHHQWSPSLDHPTAWHGKHSGSHGLPCAEFSLSITVLSSTVIVSHEGIFSYYAQVLLWPVPLFRSTHSEAATALSGIRVLIRI
jgi:hypothetical protein